MGPTVLDVSVTLGEGDTPLVRSVRLGPRLGLVDLSFKLEICNPTGSYKDRFAAAEVTAVLDRRQAGCIATSSGNTGAAIAAYAARSGLPCAIVVNELAPAAKLQQMQSHGARVLRLKGFVVCPDVTQHVYRELEAFSARSGMSLVVSAYRYCPGGMAGVERISTELQQQHPTLDHVFVPVGGGGLFTAVSRGFAFLGSLSPRVHAVQPEGCATVVAAFHRGDDEIRPVASTTRISGLSVPFDIDARTALSQLRRCRGTGILVTDDEVLEAQRLLMIEEGIWAEPAGAAALAGCIRALRDGTVAGRDSIVCLVTGHGFKDGDSLARAAAANPVALTDVDGLGHVLAEVAH
jgi:threonine synthase